MFKKILNKIKTSDQGQRRAAGRIAKFLAFMLVLTFVSRGTAGATMPRVDIATPSRSEIIDAVSGMATVSSTDIIYVDVPSGLRIAEVLAATGSMVYAGDPIVQFDFDSLYEAYVREYANLTRMRMDYERMERGEHLDTASILNAQNSLNRAREDYNATRRAGETEVAAAQSELDALLFRGADDQPVSGAAPSQIRAHERAVQDYLAARAQADADLTAAHEAFTHALNDDAALQNALRNHERAREDFEQTYNQGNENIAAAQAVLAELNARRPADVNTAALDNARTARDRARDDYNAVRRDTQTATENAQHVLFIAWNNFHAASSDPAADLTALMAEIERAQAALTQAEQSAAQTMLAATRRLEDAEASFAQAQRNQNQATDNELEQAQNALENAQAAAANNLTAAQRRLEDAEVALENAQASRATQLLNAESTLMNAQNRVQDNLNTATRRMEDAGFTLSSELERAQSNLTSAINRTNDNNRSAARRVEDAQIALNNAQQNHQRSTQQATDTESQNQLSLSTLRFDIARAEASLDVLASLKNTSAVLYAQDYGVIAAAMQNGATTNDNAIVTMRDMRGGFEAHMNISAQQAQRLTVGSAVTVTTGGGTLFFTPTVVGHVSSIGAPNEVDRVNITVHLPGTDWNEGQRVDAQVIFERNTFDLALPLAAVRSDNTGYFIYILQEQHTVLGLQYTVHRVNVTINASDPNMVSVHAPIDRNTQIITGSSRPVTAGDRVRLHG